MGKDYFVSPPNTGCPDFSVGLMGACRETPLRWYSRYLSFGCRFATTAAADRDRSSFAHGFVAGDDFVSIFSKQDSCVGLSHRHLATSRAVDFSGDVASLIAGQEDEDGGDLSRLGGTSEDGL
jgi:hypothetical protein